MSSGANEYRGPGSYTEELYDAYFKKVSEHQVIGVRERDVSLFDVWHVRLAEADGLILKWMADKDVVQDMDISQRSV